MTFSFAQFSPKIRHYTTNRPSDTSRSTFSDKFPDFPCPFPPPPRLYFAVLGHVEPRISPIRPKQPPDYVYAKTTPKTALKRLLRPRSSRQPQQIRPKSAHQTCQTSKIRMPFPPNIPKRRNTVAKTTVFRQGQFSALPNPLNLLFQHNISRHVSM